MNNLKKGEHVPCCRRLTGMPQNFVIVRMRPALSSESSTNTLTRSLSFALGWADFLLQ